MTRTARPTRALALATLWAIACVGTAVPATGAAAGSADPGWGPAQDAPPYDSLPRTVVFPDGTLMAVWTQRPSSSDTDMTVRRSTRAPGGSWTATEVLPTEAYGFTGIAPGHDGALQVATATWAGDRTEYEVRTWNPDGTVGEVSLSNFSSGYLLHGDAEGDLLAERVVRNKAAGGFHHAFRYFDGSTWQPLPAVAEEPRDLVVLGSGDSVWMASYTRPENTLRVRRWKPGMATWKVEWSRDYPSGHPNAPYVAGMDLAAGSRGRVVLTFSERATARTDTTIVAVRRVGRSGWTRARILQRVALKRGQVVTAPVVAAAGDRTEVAWTVPARRGTRKRVVRIARLREHGPQVRRLTRTTAFRGAWDLGLDVDVRDDGDVLITYVERQVDQRDLVAWLGPHDALGRTTLLEDVTADPVTSVLVPGLAAVIASPEQGRLVSRVWES